MDRYVQSTVNVIVDRSVEGLIAAVLIALVLALVVSGVYALLRQRVSDPSVLLTCLVLAANVVAMTVAGGYLNQIRSRSGSPGGDPGSGPGFRGRDGRFPGGFSRGSGLTSRIFTAADANRDGVLTADEATTAATKFMAEVNHGEPIEEETFRTAIRERMGPPGFGPPGPPPEPVASARSEPQSHPISPGSSPSP